MSHFNHDTGMLCKAGLFENKHQFNYQKVLVKQEIYIFSNFNCIIPLLA